MLARKPALADDRCAGHRLIAACAAAQASIGRGKDAGPLDAAEKTRLRKLALDWLRAELATDRPTALLTEPALACVRDPSALGTMSEGEKADWAAFWTDVRKAAKAIP